MSSCDNIFKDCMQRWEYPDDLNGFSTVFTTWFQYFNDDERKLLINMIRNFHYYSKKRVNKYLKDAHSDLSNKKLVNDSSVTAYLKITKNDGTINSSDEYWLEYCNINEIERNLCISDISIAINDFYAVNTVVIIDDVNGSGDTFVNFLKPYISSLIGKRIIYLVVYSMENGERTIIDFSKQNNLNIKIISLHKNDIVLKNKNDIYKFRQLSNKFQIDNNYVLGYKNSQSLVAFFNNTPNNTFGIFWWSSNPNYKALFPRKDRGPSLRKLKADKLRRDRQNYKHKSTKKKNGI